MKTNVIKFEEIKKAIEVKGNTYDIPPRTAKTEERLASWDKERINKSDYENYSSLIEILFGSDGRDKIIENGEDENLDFLDKICSTAVSLYYEEKNKNDMDKIKKSFSQVDAAIGKLKTVSDISRQFND